jgi:hypothetical protein
MNNPEFYPGDVVKVDAGVGEVLYEFQGHDSLPVEYTVNLRDGDIHTYAASEMQLLDGGDDIDADDFLGEYGAVQGALGEEVKPTKQAWSWAKRPWGGQGKGKQGAVYKPTPRCNHWMVPFEVGKGLTVYLSGNATPVAVSKNALEPTAGVYLDSGWIRERGPTLLTNTSIRDDCRDDDMAVLYVPWKDMGVIPYRTLSAAVVWSLTHIKSGGRLEIGCVGGHGRTGTMLGAILIYMGRTGKEAIDEVRERYCQKAIETKGQEDLLHSLATAFKEMKQQELKQKKGKKKGKKE